jgi:hypothetical protein
MEDETPQEKRLKLALMLVYDSLCELERFAGTTEVLRPIVEAQHLCRWDDPEWAGRMDEIEKIISSEGSDGAPS